ncbi:MAG: DMT family transporter [Thermodesulfobacteriota bacterium]|nr:DMT family transporter [Thermodesulfobacteriota bacterium]
MKSSMTKDEILGIISLIGGVGLFSTVEVVSKSIGWRVDPVVLTFIRFFITGVVLLIISIPLLRLRLKPLGLKDYGIFCLNGFIGITLAIPIFHIAILTMGKASSSAVVFCVNPVFVIMLARFINGEAWSVRKWVAVVFGVSGVSFFAYESGVLTMGSVSGLGLMLLAAFFFALSICISRRVIAGYGAILLMGFSALAGSLMLLPLVLFRLQISDIHVLSEAWIPVLFLSLAGTALAYVLYYFGLMNTSAQKGALAFFLKPVLASLLAVIFLGETINMYMLLGTALILSGLFLGLEKSPSGRL